MSIYSVKLLKTKSELIQAHQLFATILEEMKKYYHPSVIEEEKSVYSKAYFINRYLADNHFCFGIFADQQLIGFQLLYLESSVAFLEWSGITPPERGHQLGQHLKLNVEDFLVENSLAHKMFCDCLTVNQESIKNLEKSGFSRIATLKNHWGHQDYYLWEKFI